MEIGVEAVVSTACFFVIMVLRAIVPTGGWHILLYKRKKSRLESKRLF